MYGILLIGIGLVILGVVGAAVWLIYLLFQPAKKGTDAATPKPTIHKKPASRGFWSWIPYLIIALIITIWTIWGALFFLTVVWIMRLDPSSDSSYTIGATEKNIAKRVYAWLFWSPIITVPVFIMALDNISRRDSVNTHVFVALLPLVFHIPLLFGLTSKSAFVFRHTQQGVLLMAIRAASASITASLNSPDLFYVLNGSLWLFGTLIARNQVIRGECWLMNRKGVTVLATGGTRTSQPEDQPRLKESDINDLLKSLNAQGNTSRQIALNAFRTGTPEARKRAVAVLSALGEVEKF